MIPELPRITSGLLSRVLASTGANAAVSVPHETGVDWLLSTLHNVLEAPVLSILPLGVFWHSSIMEC